jgi:hypothetical protein
MHRHGQLFQGDSIAIIDEGLSFGGGNLGSYGINSNTSAHGFLKCTSRKIKDKEKVKEASTIVAIDTAKPTEQSNSKKQKSPTKEQLIANK